MTTWQEQLSEWKAQQEPLPTQECWCCLNEQYPLIKGRDWICTAIAYCPEWISGKAFEMEVQVCRRCFVRCFNGIEDRAVDLYFDYVWDCKVGWDEIPIPLPTEGELAEQGELL